MSDRDPLLRLLDESRAAERGAARSRQRLLEQIAHEGASFAGVLLDLAERRSTVTLTTTTGRTHHGELTALGTDFVQVCSPQGGMTHLKLGTVTTARPHPDVRHGEAAGDRAAPLDLLLVELLAQLVDDRPRVVIVSTGGDTVAGELRAVGADVVTLGLDGRPRGVCYVAADAVAEVVVEVRG